ISHQHPAGNPTEPGHPSKEAAMPRALLYYLLQTWATDPHQQPRPPAQARKGTPAMSDRLAAHRPPAIRNLPARTHLFAIGAAPACWAPPAGGGAAVGAARRGPVSGAGSGRKGPTRPGPGAPSRRLWNVATRRPIGHRLTGPTGGVISVAFSPDGNTLAGGGA